MGICEEVMVNYWTGNDADWGGLTLGAKRLNSDIQFGSVDSGPQTTNGPTTLLPIK